MQINNYQQSPSISTVNSANKNVADSTLKDQKPLNSDNNSDQVTISSRAKELAASEINTPENLPSTPITGDKLENYANLKKAQMQYQVASDLMNIASGNNDGISAPTAAYLLNNEEARENIMQQKTMQQQYQNMQTYQQQTTKSENNWVV